jgi:hypothetical protein
MARNGTKYPENPAQEWGIRLGLRWTGKTEPAPL